MVSALKKVILYLLQIISFDYHHHEKKIKSLVDHYLIYISFLTLVGTTSTMTTTTVSLNEILDNDGDEYKNSDEIIIITTSTTTLSTTTISKDYKHPTRSTITTTITTTTAKFSRYYDIDGDNDYFDTDGDYQEMNEYDVLGHTPRRVLG